MFELRDYQKEAVNSTIEQLKTHYSGMVVMPTGSGKTVIAGSTIKRIVEDPNNLVVWLCHREELKSQAYESFLEQELLVDTWDANEKNIGEEVTVAMLLSSKKLPQALEDRELKCTHLFIDETHHEGAQTYKNLENALNPDKKVGYTATPTRLDKKTLGFETIFYQKAFLDIVRMGYLAKPNYIIISTYIKADYSKSTNDYSKIEMDKALNIDQRNQIIVDTFLKEPDKYHKTILFALNLPHAHKLQQGFEENGVKTYLVHSKINKEVRDQRVAEFKASKDPCIFINIEVAIEGFDCKDIKSVFLTRPTCSETFYMQMIGRGARRHPEVENAEDDYFNIVDFVDAHDHYANLVRTWSIEHFGREPSKKEKKAMKVDEDVAAMKKKLAEEDIKWSDAKIKKELYNVVGVLRVKSSGSEKHITLDANKKKLYNKLFEVMKSSTSNNYWEFCVQPRKFINSSQLKYKAHHSVIDKVLSAGFEYFVSKDANAIKYIEFDMGPKNEKPDN